MTFVDNNIGEWHSHVPGKGNHHHSVQECGRSSAPLTIFITIITNHRFQRAKPKMLQVLMKSMLSAISLKKIQNE